LIPDIDLFENERPLAVEGGIEAILIDRYYLQSKNTKFRLYATPLAVGMYLSLTVTFPILIGGVLYKGVESTTKKRGDSEEKRLGVINNDLLFSSGLVAGEALSTKAA